MLTVTDGVNHTIRREPAIIQIMLEKYYTYHLFTSAGGFTFSLQELNFQPCQMKTFFQMPFPINFVSKSIRAVPFTHEDYAR